MTLLKSHIPTPHASTGKRIGRRRAPGPVYDPKLLGTMQSAFASACRQLPAAITICELSRRNLARRILIHADRGERNTQRLADLASEDLRRQVVAATGQSSEGGVSESAVEQNCSSRSLGKQPGAPTPSHQNAKAARNEGRGNEGFARQYATY